MRARRSALSLLLVVLACTSAPVARAQGTPATTEWPVERNAQLLAHREWKLGLWGFDGGILDRLQVGTLWAPWLLLGPNVHLKARLMERGRFRLAFETSFLYLDLARLDALGIDEDLDGNLSVWPLEVHFDTRVRPRLLVGGSAAYSFTHTSPQYDPQDFEGSGGYDSMFVRAHVTARASERLWIVTEVDWLLYQGAGAVGSVERQIDPFIYASGEASAIVSPIEPGRGGAITASLVVRQRRFGMRLGVGYGHWVTPRLRVVVPRALPYVNLDFFGRFGGPRETRATP